MSRKGQGIMIEIRFWPVFILISIVCIVVITRIVYFPWHLENGHVGPLTCSYML